MPRDANQGQSDPRPARPLTPLGGDNRIHFRHHQPQKPTVRESGAGPGALVFPNEVKRGKKADVSCLACGKPLISRQGERRMWHFAHQSTARTTTCGESALHLAAKAVLQKSVGKHLRIPSPRPLARLAGKRLWPKGYTAPTTLEITHVELEKALPGTFKKVDSVVTGWIHLHTSTAAANSVERWMERRIAVEINVRNRKTDVDRRALAKSQTSAIEIDVAGTAVEEVLQRPSVSCWETALRILVLGSGARAPRRWLTWRGRVVECNNRDYPVGISE